MKRIALVAAALLAAGLVGSASAAVVSGTGASGPNPGTITINADGTVTVVQPVGGSGFSGTYDQADDVVYNVINNWTTTGIAGGPAKILTSLGVVGTGIGGFDGDGIDNYANSDGTAKLRPNTTPYYGDAGAGGDLSNTGVSGYAGYAGGGAANAIQTVSDTSHVLVTFGGGGLGAGGTAFFSLEAEAGFNGITGTTPNQTVPLPAAAWMGMIGLGGAGFFARKRAKQA